MLAHDSRFVAGSSPGADVPTPRSGRSRPRGRRVETASMPDARPRGGSGRSPASGVATLLCLLPLAGCRLPLALEGEIVHVPNLVNETLDDDRGWPAGAGSHLAGFENDVSAEPVRPESLSGDLVMKDPPSEAGSAGEIVSLRVQPATSSKESARSNR